jgi:hypothetical protein
MASKLEVDPLAYDNRMIEWNLKHEKLSREQLKSHLAGLPDDAANSETMKLDEEGDSGS